MPAASDSLLPATETSICTPAFKPEIREPVQPAGALNDQLASSARLLSAPSLHGGPRLQAVLGKPMSDRSRSALERLSDARNWQARRYQLLQPLPFKVAPRRMLLCVRRAEPVLLHPSKKPVEGSLPERLAMRSMLSPCARSLCNDCLSITHLL
jgi:hypothetical protein